MTVRPAWFLDASAFRHFDKLSDRKLSDRKFSDYKLRDLKFGDRSKFGYRKPGDRFSAVVEPVEATFRSLMPLRQAL